MVISDTVPTDTVYVGGSPGCSEPTTGTVECVIPSIPAGQSDSVLIEVRVDEPEDLKDNIDPRQGMEGKVAIECGKRSLFYAVTHEFADFVRVSMF